MRLTSALDVARVAAPWVVIPLGLACSALVIAVPAVAATVLVLAGLLTLAGMTVVSAVALPRGLGRRWLPVGLAALTAGLLTGPLVRLLERPLAFGPVLVLAAAALLVAAALALAGAGSARTRAGFAFAAMSGGLIASTTLTGSWDATGFTLWTLNVAAIGVASAVTVLRAAGRSPGRQVTLAAAAGSLFALAAPAWQYSALVVSGDITEPAVTALRFVGAGALLLGACCATALLPPGLLRPVVARVLLAGAAGLALVLVAQSGLAALAVPADSGLPRVTVGGQADYVLAASMTGEAGAMPREEFRGMTFEECDQLNSRDCFITVYDDIALKEGIGAAVKDIVGKVKGNLGVTFPAHCHQVVHNLGQLAFTLAPRFEDAAVLDPQVCGTGYTHGLWEQQFTVLGDSAMFEQTATLCTDLNMTTPWYKWTCSHILGHLIVTRMMDDPTRALEYCTQITDPQSMTDCQAGGWMNFFQDDVVIATTTKNGSLENLFSVCYGALEEVKFLCYQELFPAVYPLVDNSDFLAGQACLQYAEESGRTGDPWQWGVSYADRCVQGLARAVTVSSFQDYRIVGPRCLSMPVDARDACLTAAASSVVLNTGSTKAGFALCRQVSDDEYRAYCYFWSKHSRKLLANGPNSENLPQADEIRLPQAPYTPGGDTSSGSGSRSQPFTVPG